MSDIHTSEDLIAIGEYKFHNDEQILFKHISTLRARVQALEAARGETLSATLLALKRELRQDLATNDYTETPSVRYGISLQISAIDTLLEQLPAAKPAADLVESQGRQYIP